MLGDDDKRLLAYLSGRRDTNRTQSTPTSRERFNQRTRNTPYADVAIPRLRGEARDPTANTAIERTKNPR